MSPNRHQHLLMIQEQRRIARRFLLFSLFLLLCLLLVTLTQLLR